jgi:hypothetical protein
MSKMDSLGDKFWPIDHELEERIVDDWMDDDNWEPDAVYSLRELEELEEQELERRKKRLKEAA